MRQTIQENLLFLLSVTSYLVTKPPIFPSLSPLETQQTIEHIFLYQVKENTDQETINYLIQQLKDLDAIPGVFSLATGPVRQIYSSSSSLNFGIFFHSRFKTKQDLDYYMNHPLHLKLVHDLTDPLLGDYMLVDWVFRHNTPLLQPSSGSAMRVAFLKIKEGLNLVQSQKQEVFKVIGEHIGGRGLLDEQTYGENFATGAKGYSFASLAIFPGVNELQLADSCEELTMELMEKLKELVQSILVVDYLV